MTSVADNTPVIIGVGQISERIGEPGYAERSPMDLAGAALAAALADAQAALPLAPALDTLAAIRQFEISTPWTKPPFGRAENPPRAIASRVGADPARAILEPAGGEAPQRLVGELAAEILAGRSRLAALVGAEATSTVRSLQARGEQRDWAETSSGSLEDRGMGLDQMSHPTMLVHGVAAPIPAYALAENVRREAVGLSLAEYRREIARLFAPFTRVAARNPHAAAPEALSLSELAELGPRNRLVAEPYGRLVVSRDKVNQGAALVLASAGEARRLGVPEERWVHIHAVANGAEPTLLARADMARSPAAEAAISAAFDLAQTAWPAIAHIDLYSCFALPVFNLLDAFGLAADDPRGWTLTGGLPFFGGAGNNYATHAIAEAVERCRAGPGSLALVGANGGIMNKYAAGIYSTTAADWSVSRWTSLSQIEASVDILEAFDGEALAETFTIQPRRDGEVATIVARSGNARLCANSSDPEVLAQLRAGPMRGRAVRIESSAEGINRFWFI